MQLLCRWDYLKVSGTEEEWLVLDFQASFSSSGCSVRLDLSSVCSRASRLPFRRAQMRAGAMSSDTDAGEAGEQGLKKVIYLAARAACIHSS